MALAPIDPPPVALMAPCDTPADLPAGATAQALAAWSLDWIGAYWCTEHKRRALVEGWPR